MIGERSKLSNLKGRVIDHVTTNGATVTLWLRRPGRDYTKSKLPQSKLPQSYPFNKITVAYKTLRDGDYILFEPYSASSTTEETD